MKILVLSDSHGRIENLKRVCDMHADADIILFAGDGVADLRHIGEYSERLVCVHGNCDAFSGAVRAPAVQTLTVEGKELYLTHGHHLSVKSGPLAAGYFAEEHGIDILVFGHTHIPYESCRPREDGGYVRLFNPGALKDGSFGLIMIDGDNILMSHGTLK